MKPSELARLRAEGKSGPSMEQLRDAMLNPVPDYRELHAALVRAHRLLDSEHGHSAETWADRERFGTGDE